MIEWKPYRWNGKTYKTITGLFRAVVRRHPGCSMSFGPAEMFVRSRTRTEAVYAVTRAPDANIIDNQPKE